jgi:8-oxo-dGTP diphosphatase
MIVPAAPRKVTRVAVGVLTRDDGCVLLADRPCGKPYAGYWEFPGGKIEPGEPVAAALERELHEELGIGIGPSEPWVTFEYDYPHAYVRLYFRRIRHWRGEPHAREGQRLQFVHPRGALPQPLLPAAIPALRWLWMPRSALVVSAQSALMTGAASRTDGAGDVAPQIIVVDADWRTQDQAALVSAWRAAFSGQGDLLLAAGAGASDVAGVDGMVLDCAAALPSTAGMTEATWRGVWADSLEAAPAALRLGFDFMMLRRDAADELRGDAAAPLPLFRPVAGSPTANLPTGTPWTEGCWIDLRSQPASLA